MAKRFKGWGAAVLAVLVLAVPGTATATTGTAKAERPLVVMLDSEPATLNPFLATDAYGVRLSHQLSYETLVTLDDNLGIAPGLAESWKRLSPTRYRFRLLQGVRFQDGSPLETADVAYTLRTFMAPETASPYGATLREKIKAIRPVDRHTFDIELTAPYADILSDLILPVVARSTAPAMQYPGKTLNGTGPFRLAGRSVGEIVLTRNETYHGRPAGVARVVFKVVKDENTRLLKFLKGDIDLGINVLPLDKLVQFSRAPLDKAFFLKEDAGLSYQYLGLNLDDPILANKSVRRALAYAINVDALIAYRQKGHSTRASGLFPPHSPYADPSVRPIPYDPARAKALLDEAGYPERNGRRFTLVYKTSTDRSAVVQARIIQNDLRRVGVKIEVRSYEWATFYDDIKKGNFQLYSLRWIGVFDPGFLYELFRSDKVPPNGRNRGHYSNPEVDALLDRAQSEQNEGKRRALYRQVDRILADDLPYIPLWFNNNVAVVSRGLTGFRLHPSGGFEHLAEVRWKSAKP